ncbi:MAG TPA: hypothetical protein PLL41_01965, partial [Smithella sp.]|nr:hypothetical protein [Smithella sp.]
DKIFFINRLLLKKFFDLTVFHISWKLQQNNLFIAYINKKFDSTCQAISAPNGSIWKTVFPGPA